MTQKLNIDIVARDKSKQALNGVQKSLGRLKDSVFNLRNAFLGLGAGLVIKNLVNTGKSLENLRTRLKFLLKDTNEGAKAFENMTKFASQVPFSLEEIQSGSGILATVTDNADDLQQMLEITGNVAAVTGLDFRTAAEQIQRSFSAGIGAADLFREKGVRNMLGFKAGATVSIEETVDAFERVFAKGGRFGKATDELAETFEGTLSMVGDKILQFKFAILEAGLFESLKAEFGSLDDFMEENSKNIEKIGTDIGIALGFAVTKVADGIKVLKDNMDKFATLIKFLVAVKVVTIFSQLESL
jgi:phage tail tape-measure protein